MQAGKSLSPLLTDLYEMTMAAAYYRREMCSPATFSLFVREYPSHRGYLVSAGLEHVLDYLEAFQFDQKDLGYLKDTGLFPGEFLDYLETIRFTGNVHAIPEGRLFFKDEPVLEITAPIIEAQLLESFVINVINLQVSIATKASRCVHAAQGRNLIDFSLRRTQGMDAGLKVARASYLAGFGGTSNVLGGKAYGIPISGTMAHSFITSFEEEIVAFRAFAETFPDNTVLLIDTYDTIAGAKKAAEVGKEMERRGYSLKGVRLDSGDMAQLSKDVRKVLTDCGLESVKIFASGAFDEYKITDVLQKGAEIDAFGIGTKMGVSADAPYTDMAYKLVQYGNRPVLKLSTGKKTLVSKKQVFRTRTDTRIIQDSIALREEEMEGEPLLKPVMEKGERTDPQEPLATMRQRFSEEFALLDDCYKALKDPDEFPVKLGPELKKLQEKVVRKVIKKELGES